MKVILKFEPITLPPANEVCVKNSVHRGGVWSAGFLVLRVCSGGRPPGTATAAGDTHPTGMHSCSLNAPQNKQLIKKRSTLFLFTATCTKSLQL